MARQGRKNKNELDIILEQLKKSYSSDALDSLEDDLLESPTNEEDTELNEILGKIFTYDAPRTPSAETDETFDEEITEEIGESSTFDSTEEIGVINETAEEFSELNDNDEVQSSPSDVETVDNVLKEMFSKKKSRSRRGGSSYRNRKYY